MASGQCAPHQQVEHMAAPTNAAEPFNSLLPTESRPHMAMNRRNRLHVAASGYGATPVVWLPMSVSALGNDGPGRKMDIADQVWTGNT